MIVPSNMPSILPRSSSTKEQRNGEGSGVSRSHLFLNVYDLTPINNYLYWFGLGIFHTGIEVHGMEYGFGAHDYATSGVFEVEPKSCPGFVFRRSVWLGATDMSRVEFRMFIEQLSGKYYGDTYHLIAKNCNHFTDDVCMRLTGKPIPGWVNRLARLVSGSFCNCLLPENIQVSAVRHLPDHPALSGLHNNVLSGIEGWRNDLLEIIGWRFSTSGHFRGVKRTGRERAADFWLRKEEGRGDITDAATSTTRNMSRGSAIVEGHRRLIAVRRNVSVRRLVEVQHRRKKLLEKKISNSEIPLPRTRNPLSHKLAKDSVLAWDLRL